MRAGASTATAVVTTHRSEIETGGHGDVHDITDRVADAIAQSGSVAGIATVFVVGSAAAVMAIEFQPEALTELHRLLEQIAPRWGDDNDNAVSYVRAALLGPSLTVPFAGRRPVTDASQQIMLLELDRRPRRREIVVQVIGE